MVNVGGGETFFLRIYLFHGRNLVGGGEEGGLSAQFLLLGDKLCFAPLFTFLP